jgi:hypothetical protein
MAGQAEVTAGDTKMYRLGGEEPRNPNRDSKFS